MSDAVHVTEVDLRTGPGAAPQLEYRWVCSCGSAGAWKTRAFQARNGGERHVAMLERSR